MESITPKGGTGMNKYAVTPLTKIEPIQSVQGADQRLTQNHSVPKMTVEAPHKTQEQAVEEFQKVIDAVQGPKKMLEVSVHQETKAIMIKVLNEQSGELIREIPSEKLLDVAARMMELVGIIVDTKV